MRPCGVEHNIEEHVQQLLKTPTTSGVGLLIGRIGHAKSFLLLLARVPDQDGAEPASHKKSSSPLVVHLDEDWIAEYALQVTRMLPGGLSVIGLYLIAGLKDFEKSAPKLCAVAKHARTDRADGCFLLHIEAATGKLTLKKFSVAAKPALNPVDFKFAPVVSSFTLLTCSVNLDLDAAVSEGEPSLCGCFQRLLQQETSRIRGSIATVGGVPLRLGVSLLDALPERSSKGAGHPFTLELLLPLSCGADCYGDTGTRRKAFGRIRMAGRLDGFALVPQRESSAAAVAALQDDLASSLAARLEALEEEAHMVQASEGLDNHPLLVPPSRLAVVAPLLPSRVFIPTKAGFPVCEYVMEGEEAADAVSRAAELLGPHHIPDDAHATGGECGHRVSVPQAPWDPWSDQETRKRPSFQQKSLWTTMPLWATLLLWMVVGIAASMAALPLSNWILRNPTLAEKDEQFNTAIRDELLKNS